eukprot:TRINITY_DN117440_c0_g1_i1.p1 TRINITY_DN117440_c0_g1~~TRINITY_DN117440_c0_g1_i1.p1  ORF type:complete len:553 (-),score=51.16 TRINITY_DN117440_c0_g1_i1:132-1745(-)
MFDDDSFISGCWRAFRRLFGFMPGVTLTIVGTLAFSTLWHGWLYPEGSTARWHSPVELFVFASEIVLLVVSYVTAVLRGPGFVPKGWTPSDEDLLEYLDPEEELPLKVSVPPVKDLLQYCTKCKGYKPSRAHHCSTCKRCVLWMDHHCPWTNTCVGHSNFKAFIQFTHYVPIACLHAVAIHSEIFVVLTRVWMERKQKTQFWRTLLQISTMLQLLAWLVALIVMLLLGSMCFEMRYTIENNLTMIEDYAIEKAASRRRQFGERKFVFPYNLGKALNWEEIMGTTIFSRYMPGPATPCDAVWPSVNSGCSHFDLSTEQIAQKAHKLYRSSIGTVERDFQEKGRCCCTYWCWIGCRFGWKEVCDCQACGESKLTALRGEKILFSYSHADEAWVHAQLLKSGDSKERLDGPRGWLPKKCLNDEDSKPYEVPKQALLQGSWLSEGDDRHIVVHGLVARGASSRLPFVLRAEGEFTELLGCRLLECDGKVAKWSNGETWTRLRPQDTENRSVEGSKDEQNDDHFLDDCEVYWTDQNESKKDA